MLVNFVKGLVINIALIAAAAVVIMLGAPSWIPALGVGVIQTTMIGAAVS